MLANLALAVQNRRVTLRSKVEIINISVRPPASLGIYSIVDASKVVQVSAVYIVAQLTLSKTGQWAVGKYIIRLLSNSTL